MLVFREEATIFSPLEYSLCDAVGEKCYSGKPETIELLKTNICDAIAKIQPHTLAKVRIRVRYCEASRGSHMHTIIFHAYF